MTIANLLDSDSDDDVPPPNDPVLPDPQDPVLDVEPFDDGDISADNLQFGPDDEQDEQDNATQSSLPAQMSPVDQLPDLPQPDPADLAAQLALIYDLNASRHRKFFLSRLVVSI